jgi:hypothetical protein
MVKTTVSVNIIDRRESLKWIAGGGVLIAATVFGVQRIIQSSRALPDISSRTIGEKAVPIPDSWYRGMERISIDSRELSRENIDTLTRTMQPINYSRICNSNPNKLLPTNKYGVSLPEALEKIQFKSSSNALISSTDWYALVPEQTDKTFLSISKTNIPEKYWSGKDFEQAKNARLTYSGVFFPEERAQAWKDLVDVNSISFPSKDINPGTYFLGPDGKMIVPENKDVSMSLDKLVFHIQSDNGFYMRIDYSDLKQFAENSSIKHDNRIVPYLRLQDILEGYYISYRNKAFIFHGNNYSVSIPPWRQKGLGIIFDDKYASKYGVPTKLIGGEFLNKAAQIGGFYRIDTIPMPT